MSSSGASEGQSSAPWLHVGPLYQQQGVENLQVILLMYPNTIMFTSASQWSLSPEESS